MLFYEFGDKLIYEETERPGGPSGVKFIAKRLGMVD
jgi:hypothetical protein